ncbi:hypothetical protein M0804_009888 [Polistes exclamans]|nr:hypothetical protein M0804_009888 [Polistes exclamans]
MFESNQPTNQPTRGGGSGGGGGGVRTSSSSSSSGSGGSVVAAVASGSYIKNSWGNNSIPPPPPLSWWCGDGGGRKSNVEMTEKFCRSYETRRIHVPGFKLSSSLPTGTVSKGFVGTCLTVARLAWFCFVSFHFVSFHFVLFPFTLLCFALLGIGLVCFNSVDSCIASTNKFAPLIGQVEKMEGHVTTRIILQFQKLL